MKKAAAKHPAAVALGKLRAASMSDEDREKASSGGGRARAEKLSPARKKAIAKKAAKARWDGKKNAQKP